MAEVTAVKIPPYNFCDPQLWFSTPATIVRDLIITPEVTDQYGAIKAQLIQRTGESSQQEIWKRNQRRATKTRGSHQEILRTMNRRAASHNVPKSLCWNFSSAATEFSAILASSLNNRRKAAESSRQRSSSEHTQRFTFDKRHKASSKTVSSKRLRD
ncbi:hypothetical protein TNIN_294061 [Trichonephila inaurata madagascariensis]|uniref:DUF7041 domain-containing protein n=1 Tax=Trichonephila inaurata madagascariensis TaxID=2747483 RepID=A0A8X7C2B2_9ARAC|nr:hypothetical protein TNIN_294061 [Trichonephila inaurata madagascariensis]